MTVLITNIYIITIATIGILAISFLLTALIDIVWQSINMNRKDYIPTTIVLIIITIFSTAILPKLYNFLT